MGKYTKEGFEYDDGTLVSKPEDGEIRVMDLDGNTMDVYREGDMEYHEWLAKFKLTGGLTIEELIAKLQLCKNKKAVACLCVDSLSYSAINGVLDATRDDADDIGNALLTLDPESEVAMALEQLEA